MRYLRYPLTLRAFTLIELLMILAILAILAAILFPVCAQARQQACATNGLSDTRRIALDRAIYAQDYDTPPFAALVFSKTTGFRHDSIPDGIAAIERLGNENNFTVDATEDATTFTDANLAHYDVVVFLCTTGTILENDQKAAFERYIEAGGGFVGIHSASDTEYDWAWYGHLVGAYFQSHPAIQQADIQVVDPDHPSTAPLPRIWRRTDEWYNFRINPRGSVHVLAVLDETTYTGGTMGLDHPISWCHAFDGGRAWYTGMGHTVASYTEPLFVAHILGGLRSAAGVDPAGCRVPKRNLSSPQR